TWPAGCVLMIEVTRPHAAISLYSRSGVVMTHLRPRASYRRGYTLVELIVVMAILTSLMALLVGTVLHVREAANRAACANNLRQLTLALHNYHESNGAFPAAAVISPHQHGWAPFLLEYLEQQSMTTEYDWSKSWYAAQNQPVVTTHLSIMLCPS